MIEYHLPFADYAARPGLSATVLKACRKSMLHGRQAATVRRGDTAALARGRLIHTAILEPGKMFDRVAIWEGGRKAGKEFAAFVDSNIGREIITPDEIGELLQITAAVHAKPEAGELLAGAFIEASVFWEDKTHGHAKERPDAFFAGRPLVDVKSVSDITPRACERQFYDFGYAVQLGWYVRGLRSNDVDVDGAYIIAVESKPPFDVAVYRLDADYLRWGEREAVRLANAYRACERSGEWPGVCAGVRVISAPAWAADEVASVPPSETVDVSEIF